MQEFLLVLLAPLQHKTQRSLRKLLIYFARLKLYRNSIFTISGVKVRWAVLPIKHADRDSKKPADFRHLR